MFLQAALFAPLLLPSLQPVVAQSSNATCNADFEWSFNSLGQSPCVMAAYLRAACKGNHQINALPPGYSYNGPGDPAYSEPCWCSSVTYSLYEACQLCQGVTENTKTWGEWTVNCTRQDTFNGVFPRDIPFGTAVPAWAYESLQNSDTFSVIKAQNFKATNATEFKDGGAPSAGASSTGRPTGTQVSNPSNSAVPPNRNDDGGTNVGAIVGGVVGGVAGLALIGGLIAWFLLRRKRIKPTTSPTPALSQPLMQEPKPDPYHPTFTPQPPASQYATGKLYNPSDPSTFPTNTPTNPTPAPTYYSRVDEIRPNRLNTPSGHPHLPEI